MAEATLLSYDNRKLDRQELALVPAPQSTATHQVIPHHEVIGALVETLGFRHLCEMTLVSLLIVPSNWKLFARLFCPLTYIANDPLGFPKLEPTPSGAVEPGTSSIKLW